jgi:hypothetical protein
LSAGGTGDINLGLVKMMGGGLDYSPSELPISEKRFLYIFQILLVHFFLLLSNQDTINPFTKQQIEVTQKTSQFHFIIDLLSILIFFPTYVGMYHTNQS